MGTNGIILTTTIYLGSDLPPPRLGTNGLTEEYSLDLNPPPPPPLSRFQFASTVFCMSCRHPLQILCAYFCEAWGKKKFPSLLRRFARRGGGRGEEGGVCGTSLLSLFDVQFGTLHRILCQLASSFKRMEGSFGINQSWALAANPLVTKLKNKKIRQLTDFYWLN